MRYGRNRRTAFHVGTLCSTLRLAGCSVIALATLVAASVRAERWYGNIVLSTLHNSTTPVSVDDGTSYQAHAIINVEDVLFYKNRIRLATNQDWRRHSDGYELYRPIYYLDLNGYGYTLNSSYSGYTDKGLMPVQNVLINVYTRDWRNLVQITPSKLPPLSLLYNRIRTFNNEPWKVNDLLQQSVLAQSSYSRGMYSLRGVHQQVRTDNYGIGRLKDVVKTSTGNVSLSSPVSKVVSANTVFSYFDNRRSIAGVSVSKGSTGSVTALVTSSAIKQLSASVSYSGQFTTNQVLTNDRIRKRSESFGANVGYTPTSYLDFQAAKGYQIDGTGGKWNINEYVTIQATLSRYFRAGVDTRFSASRMIFQQGDRTIEYRDTLGRLDSTRQINHHYIDTWYGSVALSPISYIRMSQGLSIARDNRPVQANNRYQMTATTDAQFFLRSNLEGKLSYGNSYQGDRLRIGHVSAETYNLGASWAPIGSASVAMAYIYAVFNSTSRNTSSSVSVTASYSFRRIYSVLLSYNRRDQNLGTAQQNSENIQKSAPESINGQIRFRTSARSTLTIGYLRDRSNTAGTGGRNLSSWQSTLNLQI